jgi:hypothetical protein
MKDEFNTIPDEVSERTERLICRMLDSEITDEEQTELNMELRRSASARAMLAEYQSVDARAMVALREDFAGVATASMGGLRRGLWLAAAGAVLSMAAVVALSFLPRWLESDTASLAQRETSNRPTVASDRISPVIRPATLVDYRDEGVVPTARFHDIHRDVIGIPDPSGDTIYILERNVQSTRMQPISGDF